MDEIVSGTKGALNTCAVWPAVRRIYILSHVDWIFSCESLRKKYAGCFWSPTSSRTYALSTSRMLSAATFNCLIYTQLQERNTHETSRSFVDTALGLWRIYSIRIRGTLSGKLINLKVSRQWSSIGKTQFVSFRWLASGIRAHGLCSFS